MTEKINVTVRKGLNRAHAAIAFIFWLGLGIFLGMRGLGEKILFWMDSGLSLFVCFLCGGLIGIVRTVIINDKYAWQVATLEEIQDVRALLESEKDYNKINEVSNNVSNLNNKIDELVKNMHGDNQLLNKTKPVLTTTTEIIENP